MARKPRIYSISGYMHIVVHGVADQIIFHDRQDRSYFLKLLSRYSNELELAVCAYCLMDNHVHLLVKDADQSISLFMKKIGVSYSYFFNRKYDRKGHLFQDRFWSEIINDETYFLTVFRYILNNPQKAGVCKAEEYEWSSYDFQGKGSGFVDRTIFQNYFEDEADYRRFIAEGIDCESNYERRDGDWAKKVYDQVMDRGAAAAIRSDKTRRDQIIRRLKERGLSTGQIMGLTGLSRYIVHRACADKRRTK